MIKEFCAENFTNVPKAIASGANRIELCDNLAVGGTTPSYGVIQATMEYTKAHGVTVMVMIRPRGGDFSYSQSEVSIMRRDIGLLQEIGITGIVLGAVRDAWIDEEVMKELLTVSKQMEVTFHMAFDEIEARRQLEAIDWLAQNGVKRILTHGGDKETIIQDNLDRLEQFIEYAGNRIIIMPGGGLTHANASELAEKLGIKEVHGTKIVNLDEGDVNNETFN